MNTPLHSKDINVDGDDIYKLALTQVAQETQDENEDFESQRNANDSQDQPIPNVLGVLKNPNVMDLSPKNMNLLPSNSHQPPMVDLLNFLITFTHDNTTIKKKKRKKKFFYNEFYKEKLKKSCGDNGED